MMMPWTIKHYIPLFVPTFGPSSIPSMAKSPPYSSSSVLICVVDTLAPLPTLGRPPSSLLPRAVPHAMRHALYHFTPSLALLLRATHHALPTQHA